MSLLRALLFLSLVLLVALAGCHHAGNWAHPGSFTEPPQRSDDLSRSQR